MSIDHVVTKENGIGRGVLPICFLAAFFAIASTISFYPGFMSFDSLQQYRQAIGTIPLSDAHPTAMTLVWRFLNWIVGHPGVMLVFHQAIYWTAVTIFALAIANRLYARAAIVLIVGLWPPLFINSLHLWKDVGMLACYMLAVASLLADRRSPHYGWLVTAVIALVYGTAVRHNAILALLPLSIMLAERVAVRFPNTLRTRWGAGAATVVLMFGSWFGVNAATNAGAQHVSGLGTILVWDMVAVSVAVGEDLVPPYMPRLVKGDILPQLEATFSPNANYWSYSVVSPYPPNGSRPLVMDWLKMIAVHPMEYLEHRAQLFATILGLNGNVYYPFHPGVDENEFGASLVKFPGDDQGWLIGIFEKVAALPIYPLWSNLLIIVGISIWACVGFARRRSIDDYLRNAFYVSASGLAIALPLFVLAPAADYRFILWPVACAVLSVGIVASGRRISAVALAPHRKSEAVRV